MASVQLTSGAVAKVKEGVTDPATLKIADVQKLPNGTYTCTFTDGISNIQGRLTSQIKKSLEDGTLSLKDGAVCSLENYVMNELQGVPNVIVTAMTVLQQGSGKDANDPTAAASDAAGSKPDQHATPTAAAAKSTPPSTPAGRQQGQGHSTPAAAAAGGARSLLTPGPIPSPSEEVKGTPGFTPSVSHQPSFTPMSVASTARPSASPITVAERAGVQPIAALNPYNKNWCIKARVTRKGLMRSIGRGGGAQTNIFSVELVDAQGTQIEGSFWRESADKFYDSLEEGKVYYFTNFSVKPANKQYATVRNDYQINFDNRTEVEEAKDQSGISADLQIDLVPFDKLVKHIGRKAPIDVLGVITSVGTIGSIKRKADNSDVTRRDITLADKTCSSVVLTLWGDAATRLDLLEGSVLQVTSVKATEYNGCSLSGLSRSKVTVDPETPEAGELRSWWSSEGSTATITPLSQALGGGVVIGGPRRNKLELLSAIRADGPLPAPDAKPTYHDVTATIAEVMYDEERGRNIMYQANPTSGKKVVEQDGRWWCEGDGCYVDTPEHRYMMTIRLADLTGEAYVTVFNEQAETLLGCSAGEAAMKQQNDPAAFNSLLRNAQWNAWSMTLSSKTREYQGELKLRTTAWRLKPMDYAEEGRKLLQLIQQGA